MPINKAGLKKLRVKELKALIRKYNIGRLGGSKTELVDRVRNSNKYNIIKLVEKIPERVKRVFSNKQLEAQSKFKIRLRDKNFGKLTKIENVEIQEKKDEKLLLFRDKEIKRKVKELAQKKKQLERDDRPFASSDIIRKDKEQINKQQANITELKRQQPLIEKKIIAGLTELDKFKEDVKSGKIKPMEDIRELNKLDTKQKDIRKGIMVRNMIGLGGNPEIHGQQPFNSTEMAMMRMGRGHNPIGKYHPINLIHGFF